jgi:predicted  nucleic acid-binding Zn-ribbon protein
VVEEQTKELKERDSMIDTLQQSMTGMESQVDELKGKLAEEFSKRRKVKSDSESQATELGEELVYYKEKY